MVRIVKDMSKKITPQEISHMQSSKSSPDEKSLPLNKVFLNDMFYYSEQLAIYWLPCDSILIESNGHPIFGPFAIRAYAHTHTLDIS